MLREIDPAEISARVNEEIRRHESHTSSTSSWPEPRPIKIDLPSVPEFDADVLLPEPLRTYVLDEADRMPCPPDYVAAPLVVALGSVIGCRCAIKPKRRDDWLVTPNLWGGIVGEPSSKKTPASEKAMRFLGILEAHETEAQAHRLAEFEAEQAAHKAREDAVKSMMKKAAGGAKKGEDGSAMEAAIRDLRGLIEPTPPRQRRFRSNDSTVAKLGDLLAGGSDGILVFRDELVGLLASWDREGNEGDRAFYLEAWNGLSPYAIDRIGRGSLLIPTLNISVFGGIQPDLLGRYLREVSSGGDNDGRAQRFQVFVAPDAAPWEWRDRYPVDGARQRVRETFTRLAAFDPVQDGARPADDFLKVPHFSFDDPAQDLFVEWAHDLHLQLIPGEPNPILRQHFAKFEKLFCGLALILHLAEGRVGNVRRDTALRAAAWTQYLAGHARRVYALPEAAAVSGAQLLARRIAAGKLADGFTTRDVVRKGWSGLSTSALADAALGLLEECSYVVGCDDPDAPGRPTTRYRINPKVWRPE